MRPHLAALPLLVLAACAGDGVQPDDAPAVTEEAAAGATEEAAAGVVETPRAEPPATDAELAALVNDQSRFGLRLYGALRSGEGNLFLSPFSVAAALSMTTAGARGETLAEFRGALGESLEPARVHMAFAALQTDLIAVEDAPYELAIANALWTQEGKAFEAPFLATLRDEYASALEPADFNTQPEAERVRLNAWVKAQTRDRIDDLFPRGSILPTTRLVLANAISFLGTWEHQFEEKRTREGDFHLADGTKVKTPLMSQAKSFPHASVGDVQVVELPYKGGRLSMVVLLPRSHDGLPPLEAKLTTNWLAAALESLRETRVNVVLPKFEFKADAALSHALRELGVKQVFTQEADLSGMDGTHDLYLQAALHKAYVRVDEKGTEAAAATGMVFGVKSIPPQFRADRPFLFLIRDRKTGTILFLGRLVEPAAPAD